MSVMTSIMSEACKEAGIIEHGAEFMAEHYIIRAGIPVCLECERDEFIVPRSIGISPVCACGAYGADRIAFENPIDEPLTIRALLETEEHRRSTPPSSLRLRYFILNKENI